MTKVATAPISQDFIVDLQEPRSLGEVIPLTKPRGPQLHAQLQAAHDRLLPKGAHWCGNTAIILGSGIASFGFPGLMSTLIGISKGALSDPGGPAALAITGGMLAVGVLCGVGVLLCRTAYRVGLRRRADGEAAKLTNLSSGYDKMSDLERALVGYRAESLVGALQASRGSSQRLSTALTPLTNPLERMAPETRKQAELVAKLVDAIVLRNGELAPSAREDTEQLTRDVENLTPQGRAVLGSLVREPLQRAIDAKDGHRWRLKRLQEALAGARSAYFGDELPGNNQIVTRSISIIRGELARTEDQPGGSHGRAFFAKSNTLLAEQTAEYFEREGRRASIFEASERLVVAVYDAKAPPPGSFMFRL